MTRVVAAEVVRACNFSGVRRMVDVGGGHGALLEILLRDHADVQAILFDRPHAMAGARKLLQQAGVADPCEFVAGDFLDSVSRGADVYILKNIIHGWDDGRAAAILRNCRIAMPDHGRLLVIERILPDRLEPCCNHRAVAHADLTMMLGPGGRERTRAEYDAMLRASGLSLDCIKPVVSGYSVLEAVKPRGLAG